MSHALAATQRAQERRAALLDKLHGFGEAGASIDDLMDWETPDGDRNPVRTFRLRAKTLRMDLGGFVYNGLARRFHKGRVTDGLFCLHWSAL